MPNVTKVVVLAAGLGTRMRAAGDAGLSAEQAAVAATGVKALIPISSAAGAPARPFLDYVLSVCADAGITHACLVIGQDHHQIRDYYNSLKLKRLTIEFAVQSPPRGTADAVRSAQTFCGNDDFLMVNSDNFYPLSSLRGLCELKGPGVALFSREAMVGGSNIDPDRISKFAAVESDVAGNMRTIHEKPSPEVLSKLGPDIYVSMNCWRFGPTIFEAAAKIPASPRGEYEITDAAQYVIDVLKQPIACVKLDEPVLDMSSRGDITAVAERLAKSGVVL